MTRMVETIDSVAVKRRARRAHAEALAGKSPLEQTETLHRLASQAPISESVVKARAERPSKRTRARGRRRPTV